MTTNNRVEVDAHAVSMEAISREWLRIPAWVLACSGMAVMTFIFRWGWKLSYSKGVVTNLQREVTASLRAAVLYQAMVIPLVYPDLLSDLPTHLVDSYGSLPFWYAFVVTTSVGSWLKYAVSSMTGSSIAVFAVMLINTLIGLADDVLPPACISLGVVLYCVVFAYTLYITNLTVCTKQYTMAIWSTVIVKYLANGSASSAAVEMAVLDWKTGIQWDGLVLCQVYLVLLANVLSFFALPFTPGWQCHGVTRHIKAKAEASLQQDEECGGARDKEREEARDQERAKVLQLFMAKEQVRQGLCDLAIDTTGAMEKLLSHFRRGTSANALQSSYLYIRKLGARRTVVENLMEDAEWECVSFSQFRGHDRLGAVAGMLRGQRQILRILLENLKAVPDYPDESLFSEQITKEIQPKLSRFFGSWRDVLVAVADPIFLRTGNSTECSKLAALLREADDAVVEVLETLYAKGAPDNERKHCEMAFLHCLRCSCALLRVFVADLKLAPDSLKAGDAEELKHVTVFRAIQERLHELRSNLGIILFGESPSYGDALRNTGSWMLALAWCILVRGGATSCLTSVSFVFSVTLGMLFQRNVNRMVGVAMGLVFGNMPALVLLQDEESGHAKFVYFPQGLLIYMALMFAMFFAAMYGYLATGSRYSYAYLLWAGFGGSFMLTHLKAAAPGGRVSESDRASQLFLSMMDNFVGCMLVFIVDIFCVKLFKGHASSRVAEILPACLDDISAIITDFRHATRKVGIATYSGIANESEALRKAFLAVDIKRLQHHIASARYWDAEVQKEDPIWTMAGSEYKTDLISELLNLCDDAYVAVYTMQLTARSIECMAHVHSTARRVWHGLPHAMSRQAHRCSQATRAALADSLFLERTESATGLATAEASQVVVLERSTSSSSPPRWANTAAIQENTVREEASSAAISMSFLVATKLLATALASMEILLREHAFWATGEWQNSDTLASFDERATLESQVSARMLIWESDVQSFIIEENDKEVDAYPPRPRRASDGGNGGLRRKEDPPPPDVRRGRYRGQETTAGTTAEGNLSGALTTSQALGQPLLEGDSLRERP